jgi:hypothetical protein
MLFGLNLAIKQNKTAVSRPPWELLQLHFVGLTTHARDPGRGDVGTVDPNSNKASLENVFSSNWRSPSAQKIM